MKKRYVIISLLSAFLSAKGQQDDSAFIKKKLSTTDVQLLFSYYTQDNNHSAVTGGVGTENLQVYTSELSLGWKKDSIHRIQFDIGFDVISSASTDNIDFVVSSASMTDARPHAAISYGRFLRKGFTISVNTGFSIESDYSSRNVGFQLTHLSPDQSREWYFTIQSYFDDLRWGLFDNGKPQKLIYPSELRYKDWYDNHRRNSFNLEAGFYQTINKRTAVGFYPGLVFQYGLLATPFHRVYFTDGSERVENFPSMKMKVPVGLQLNRFIGTRFILRTAYRFYWDNFGITAHTISVDIPFKVSALWTLVPGLRFYTQSRSEYFKPYKEHSPENQYYTSDYDLSKFKSYKAGLGFRYAPLAVKKRTTFKEFELRYSFYKRSDGLTANVVTLFIDYSLNKKND